MAELEGKDKLLFLYKKALKNTERMAVERGESLNEAIDTIDYLEKENKFLRSVLNDINEYLEWYEDYEGMHEEGYNIQDKIAEALLELEEFEDDAFED